jgi:phosphate transport system protein
MPQSEHLSKQYDLDLDAVRSRVLEMGGLVESQIQMAIEAYSSGNLALVEQVIENDRRVNGFEVGIDDDCIHIIAKRQPAAVDLRMIMATSKIVTDLERIGDEAEKIARTTRQLHESARTPLPHLVDVRHAADVARTMLHRALDAFARRDAVAAAQVVKQDVVIDSEFRAVLRQLITFMMEEPRTITSAIGVVWIAKAAERIGDHAKNIAEQVIYIVRGTDVRHTDMANLERQALG